MFSFAHGLVNTTTVYICEVKITLITQEVV